MAAVGGAAGVAAIIAALAAVGGAAATYESGRKQASIAEDNAKIANEDADAVIRQSQEAAAFKRAQIKRLLASGRAFEAGSGFTAAGTPELVSATVQEEGEKDAMAILAQGLSNASRVRSGARISLEQGQSVAEGKQWEAGSTLLASGSNIYTQWNKGKTESRTGRL